MVSVKVINESSGNAAENKRVVLYVGKLFGGGTTQPEQTDSRGEAHFEIDPCDGEIYIDGSTKYKGRLSGRMVVYI